MNRGIRKLLFVSDAPHFGGAERYVANMAAAANRRGISASVCWHRPASAPQDVFAAANEAGAHVRMIEASDTADLFSFSRAMRAAIRAEQPDAMIINACGRPAFWVVPWISRTMGIPSAWVHHMVDQQDYRRLAPTKLGGRLEGLHWWRWPQALRHLLASTGTNAVIALNAQDRLQIAREQCVRPSRIHIVQNGVDTEQYRFSASNRSQMRENWARNYDWDLQKPFIVGTAGRLVHGKGTEMLMQALAQLRSCGLDVRMVVAGEGPDRARLCSIAERLRIRDSVGFLGHCEQMPAFYSGLDAFALCSSTESFGLVVAEAMACERAAVATPTAGARMQIDNGLTGFVLNSYSATDLAESLGRLSQQPRLREELGRNARRRICREFSIDAAFERTLNVFATCKPHECASADSPVPSAMEGAA
jgi:glycosyltransferase involved in cell wall biosynthesis